MKRFKSFISLMVILAIMLSVVYMPQGVSAYTATKLKEAGKGDYVIFGTYKDNPILWKIIGKDGDSVRLWTADVICSKPYDAAESGNYGIGSDNVQKWGSSDWSSSNLKQWLNSSEAKVYYSTYSPISKAVEYDAYDKEAGFLYNFMKEERKAIRGEIDILGKFEVVSLQEAGMNIGSSYSYWTRSDGSDIKNDNLHSGLIPAEKYEDFWNSSYSKMLVTSQGLIAHWYHYHGGYEFYINDYKNGSNFYPVSATNIGDEGDIHNFYSVCADSKGVRPALYLNGDLYLSGSGTYEDPYTLSGYTESLTLSQTSLTIEQGKTAKLNAIIKPENAASKSVTWSSMSPLVGKVDSDGNVKGLAAGKATISARDITGNFVASCIVTVTKPKQAYSIKDQQLNISRDKVWKFSFKTPISTSGIAKNVYVEDNEGKLVSTAYMFEDGGKTLFLEPTESYKSGKEYYLIVNVLKDKSGKILKKYEKMKFTIK